MHEVGRYWPLDGITIQHYCSLYTGFDTQKRAISFVRSNIFSLLFLYVCQLAVQTEVVLFTVEWGITTKSLKAISNSVRFISIKGDYNISCLSCCVQTYFIFLQMHVLPYCIENIKTNRICLHFSGIYKEVVINKENSHVGLVLFHRMTTSWMCCSCWWLWCLNILVPWSRLLTSAMGFGKHGCVISALVSVIFFRFTTYFFKSVRPFFNQFLCEGIYTHIHFGQFCHAFEPWMLPLVD